MADIKCIGKHGSAVTLGETPPVNTHDGNDAFPLGEASYVQFRVSQFIPPGGSIGTELKSDVEKAAKSEFLRFATAERKNEDTNEIEKVMTFKDFLASQQGLRAAATGTVSALSVAGLRGRLMGRACGPYRRTLLCPTDQDALQKRILGISGVASGQYLHAKSAVVASDAARKVREDGATSQEPRWPSMTLGSGPVMTRRAACAVDPPVHVDGAECVRPSCHGNKVRTYPLYSCSQVERIVPEDPPPDLEKIEDAFASDAADKLAPLMKQHGDSRVGVAAQLLHRTVTWSGGECAAKFYTGFYILMPKNWTAELSDGAYNVQSYTLGEHTGVDDYEKKMYVVGPDPLHPRSHSTPHNDFTIEMKNAQGAPSATAKVQRILRSVSGAAECNEETLVCSPLHLDLDTGALGTQTLQISLGGHCIGEEEIRAVVAPL